MLRVIPGSLSRADDSSACRAAESQGASRMDGGFLAAPRAVVNGGTIVHPEVLAMRRTTLGALAGVASEMKKQGLLVP